MVKGSGTNKRNRASDVLVVEDDPGMQDLLKRILEGAGYVVATADDGVEALDVLSVLSTKVVITDLKMPRMGGMDLLMRLCDERPDVPVVVLTAFGTVPGAVDAMKLGAFDFMTKPLPDPEHLRQAVARAMDEAHRRANDSASGRSVISASVAKAPSVRPGPDDEPVAEDPAFERVLEMASMVAQRDTTVLLTGESGTGKEVVARFIHRMSPRGSGPFVAVNCAAIPENLMESELFGHEKGAFTGAVKMHRGVFEQGGGGTLLLDEVGELPLAIQAKFLRVLEDRRVTRVGGTASSLVDVRIVAATNRNLEEEAQAHRFREDLFFRLNVFPIVLPPLRERPADIVALARRFLAILGRAPGRTSLTMTPEAVRVLQAHRWPGNVRELQNVIERAVIMAGPGPILPEHFGLTSLGTSLGSVPEAQMTLKEMERQAIVAALQACDGNRKAAAKKLGIALRTLQYKIRDYGLKEKW
ncbi:MAG: sigma-54-dependent Fis family transcriptional regulator [Deltaproteobacteria bacterium]|nr:sigma-54-dependent Fis family transcriptional regulator [Deltaproteobacteria bacterium]